MISEEEKRKIYEEMQMKYCIEDFKTRLEDIAEDEKYADIAQRLTDDDFRIMADIFLIKHECNIPDNDQYYSILKNYMDKRGR